MKAQTNPSTTDGPLPGQITLDEAIAADLLERGWREYDLLATAETLTKADLERTRQLLAELIYAASLRTPRVHQPPRREFATAAPTRKRGGS